MNGHEQCLIPSAACSQPGNTLHSSGSASVLCRSTLTSGVTPWRKCLQDLQALHSHLEAKSIRLVVGVVYEGAPPEASKIEEFAAVLTRDLNLDPRQLQQLDSNPTAPQVLLLSVPTT